MKLLIISSEYPPGPGGIANHAHNLATHLHGFGWEIVVLSPQDYSREEEIRQFNSSLSFPVARVTSGRGRIRSSAKRLRAALCLVAQHRPQVILGTGLSGVLLSALVSRIKKLPMLAIAHGSEVAVTGRCLSRVIKCAFQRANIVVAVSHFTKALLKKMDIHHPHVDVITNAADSNRFNLIAESERRAFREQHHLLDSRVLLTVGHVSERKGQEVVIRALPQILARVPQTHYFMAGLPSQQLRLTELAQNLGIGNHIHFLGKVSNRELLCWLNCCDLFLMTSRTTPEGDCEGFGIAVVEAALCGKPSVVSNNSGVIEAIQDGVTGLAVPEGNAGATAQAVLSFLLNPARLETMGQAARSHAFHQQTWQICARKYEAVLQRLLGRPALRNRTTDTLPAKTPVAY